MLLGHQHLPLLFVSVLVFVLQCKAGSTNGLAIIDAPNPGSPGHAGNTLPIAVDVSGDGQLSSDASNPDSTASTHFSLLEIYLVSAETNINLTVSNGTGLLTQESGSTVKHLNYLVPNCIAAGNYNLTFYETSTIQGQPHFIITPVSIPIQNTATPSDTACSQTAGVTVNSLQSQPQAQSPLTQPIYPGGTLPSSAPGPPFVTITLSGPLPFPIPSTVTATPSATPTTVFVVSMTTATVTTDGSAGLTTETVTETVWSSQMAVTANADSNGFLPVNAGLKLRLDMTNLLLCLLSFTVGFWSLLA
jgi:LysM repeat protein